MSQVKSTHYADAGVDIDAADDLIERIKPLAAATRIPGATKGLGGFGGVFDLAAAGFGEGSPRLVAGTDGVGTKLKIAFATGIHHTVGIDCVAMCVNDILAVGATPLFFLDYFGTGKLHPAVGEAVVAGIAAGCRQAGCWLLGGETAELPGMYADGEYDIAGFVVGAVRPDEELSPDDAAEGDVLIGVRSSGLHSNGFSLARRVLLERSGHALDRPLDDDSLTLGERLLVPTRIYVKALKALREAGVRYRAVAHITGGGLWENPPRALPGNLAAILDHARVASMAHPIFDRIRIEGGVPTSEMYRVFNMGVGLTLSVDAASVDRTLEVLRASGEEAEVIGRIAVRDTDAVVFDGMPTD
jgi:phosphoribosylformylglycinamidine cyclo-ligase